MKKLYVMMTPSVPVHAYEPGTPDSTAPKSGNFHKQPEPSAYGVTEVVLVDPDHAWNTESSFHVETAQEFDARSDATRRFFCWPDRATAEAADELRRILSFADSIRVETQMLMRAESGVKWPKEAIREAKQIEEAWALERAGYDGTIYG